MIPDFGVVTGSPVPQSTRNTRHGTRMAVMMKNETRVQMIHFENLSILTETGKQLFLTLKSSVKRWETYNSICRGRNTFQVSRSRLRSSQLKRRCEARTINITPEEMKVGERYRYPLLIFGYSDKIYESPIG